MELTDSRQSRCLETANSLQGRARRLLMARTVTALGAGGHRRTARALGGGPQDHAQRAPRTGERVHLPRGLCRTRSSAGGSLSAAPVTRYPHHDRSPKSSRSPVPSPRLAPRVRAAAVRRQRIAHKGEAAAALPTGPPSTTTRKALGS